MCPREQIRWCFLPPPRGEKKKKSVRLTVLESKGFYLSTEQTAAWRSHGGASSLASPCLAAGRRTVPIPEDTFRVSGGAAFDIRAGSDLLAGVAQGSVCPFSAEDRASPLPAQRQVPASAKGGSWWPVSPVAVSTGEPPTHPVSLQPSLQDIGAWRAAALWGHTRGCGGLWGCSLCDQLHPAPESTRHREGRSGQREMGDGHPEQVGAPMGVPGGCKGSSVMPPSIPLLGPCRGAGGSEWGWGDSRMIS